MSWLSNDAVLEAAKRSEAVVYAVSTRMIINRALLSAEYLFEPEKRMPKKTFLGDLTKLTGGALINIESTLDLDAVFLKVLDEFRNRYLLTYVPREVKRGGWHTVEVRVKNKSAKVSSRSGYIQSPGKDE
jgi:VWFA-related protein